MVLVVAMSSDLKRGRVFVYVLALCAIVLILAAMSTLTVGSSFGTEFKSLPTTRIRHGTQGHPRHETRAVRPPLPLIPSGLKKTPSLTLHGAVRKSSTRISSDSSAVETLTHTGPKAHQVEWDTTEEMTPEKSEEGTSSYNQALLNAINILMGVGLLSIPFALKEGGWAALGVLAAIWTGTNYTGKILIKCQEVNRNRDADDAVRGASASFGPGKLLKSYEDIGEAAYGKRGRQFITAVLYAELIGTCALFFILEGDHLQFLLSQVMPPYLDVPSKEQLMALTAGVFLPTTWLPDLGALSSFGLLGMLSSLGLTGCVMYQMMHSGMEFAQTVPLNMSTLPGSFGLLAFVFAGHAVFPSIYDSMADKKEYPKMLNTTYLIVGATCLLMGRLHFTKHSQPGCCVGGAGYLMYGAQTAEEVTLNLPAGMLSLFATSLILVSPFSKFALTLEPVARGVEEKLNLSMKGPTANLARLNRTGLGLGCLVLATQVPFFGQVMAIVGSFLTLTVSVIFPSLCYMKLYGGDIKNSEKLMNYSVISLGCACAVSGTWTAVNEIIKQLN